MKTSLVPAHGRRQTGAAELADSLLRLGLDVKMRVTGSSMVPTVGSGDTVVLRKAGRARIGDIVFYRTCTGHAVMHRIVRISRDMNGMRDFHTMGDALRTMEGPFPEHAIIGLAAAVEPHGSARGQMDTATATARAEAYLRALMLRARAFLESMRKRGKAFIERDVQTTR